jgi:ribosome-associated protein
VDTNKIAQIAINALENIKGQNIVVIDTSNKSSLFNTLIICTGNSSRQVAALAHNVTKDFKANGVEIIGIEGKRSGEWVLVDGGEVIVHVMLQKVREYYLLESLWSN